MVNPKDLSPEELLNCRVIIVNRCSACSNYDSSFAPGCRWNGDFIGEVDEHGFRKKGCDLITVEALLAIIEEKSDNLGG